MSRGLFIKKVWIIALIISLMGTIVFADESEMVRNTISSQIEAFKENNIEKAYTFAAPNIQAVSYTHLTLPTNLSV